MEKQITQYSRKNESEAGFVLVLAMVVLLMLSLFGVWAIQTSNNELLIAGGLQRTERQFNLSEAAANAEAINLGYSARSWYAQWDPLDFPKVMVPTTAAAYDPGGDNAAIVNDADVAALVANADFASDPTMWPLRNLAPVQDNDDDWTALPAGYVKGLAAYNDLDYRYLVTYLMVNSHPPKGHGSEMAAYNYRIQGNAVSTNTVIELGGLILGLDTSGM